MAKHARPTAEPDLSWVETLGAEHARLGSFLSRLGTVLSEPAAKIEAQELLKVLEEVATHCRQHMQHEEQDGYLSGVLDRWPNLSDRLDQLRGEHSTLQREVAECLDALRTAADASSLDEDLVVRLRTWLSDLRDHEIRENTLVQDVFNTDIGAGD